MQIQVATYSLHDIYDATFHPKGLTAPAKVFSHPAAIEPNSRAAFLFSKRLKG